MSSNVDQSKPAEDKDLKKDPKQKENLKDAQVLKLLEEDQDDFEEFEEDAYDPNPPQHVQAKQWREDWDDEDINDDFTLQLKKELQA